MMPSRLSLTGLGAEGEASESVNIGAENEPDYPLAFGQPCRRIGIAHAGVVGLGFPLRIGFGGFVLSRGGFSAATGQCRANQSPNSSASFSLSSSRTKSENLAVNGFLDRFEAVRPILILAG